MLTKKIFNNSSGIIFSGIAGLLVILMVSCDSKPPANSFPAQAERGEALFQLYCARCHGDDGTGLIIDTLDVQPKDLTLLKRRNGGFDFPINDVAVMIDGRELVAAHGPREMPVWGEILTDEGDLEEKEFKGKLGELIAYLMTIQK